MSKEKIEFKGFFSRAWTDPVLSQVIAVGIITLTYSFIQTVLKDISLVDAIKETLLFKFEVYKFLLSILFVVIVYIIVYRYRLKSKSKIGLFNIEQKVGYFTFRELYNALLNHEIKAPIDIMGYIGKEQVDLLFLFTLYNKTFNKGIEWEHDAYLYYTLAPTLMSYGLIEKVPSTSKLDTTGSLVYQTSQIGFEFYALLERFRIHNDEQFKTENNITIDQVE